MRGNVPDLAVAVITGGVFGKIVSSRVSDVVMPPIGLAVGKVDFSSLYLNLSSNTYASLAEAQKAGGPVHQHGDRLPHRILRHFPRREPGEQVPSPAGGSGTRGALDQRVSLRSFHHPSQGNALRPLYFGDQIDRE